MCVRACAITRVCLPGAWRDSVTCTDILAAMTQAPAAAAAGVAKASEAAAAVAAKASQAVGMGELACRESICAESICAPTRPKRAPADLAAAAPPTPEELEQERLLQEQRAQWAQTAHVEALCALFTGQIYKGQVEKEGYEVVLHDPLPGRYTRKA